MTTLLMRMGLLLREEQKKTIIKLENGVNSLQLVQMFHNILPLQIDRQEIHMNIVFLLKEWVVNQDHQIL
jgi:hypothetical protein